MQLAARANFRALQVGGHFKTHAPAVCRRRRRGECAVYIHIGTMLHKHTSRRNLSIRNEGSTWPVINQSGRLLSFSASERESCGAGAGAGGAGACVAPASFSARGGKGRQGKAGEALHHGVATFRYVIIITSSRNANKQQHQGWHPPAATHPPN